MDNNNQPNQPDLPIDPVPPDPSVQDTQANNPLSPDSSPDIPAASSNPANQGLSTDQLIAKYNSEELAENPPKPKAKIPRLLFPAILVVVLLAGGAYALTTKTKNSSSGGSSSVASNNLSDEESAIDKFISAVRSGDKASADDLQTAALTDLLSEENSSQSFYDQCQEVGEFCTGIFAEEFLAKAQKTVRDYRATNDLVGKEAVYVIQQEDLDSTGNCSSKSVTTLNIAAVKQDQAVLIDKAEPNIQAGLDCSFDPLST